MKLLFFFLFLNGIIVGTISLIPVQKERQNVGKVELFSGEER